MLKILSSRKKINIVLIVIMVILAIAFIIFALLFHFDKKQYLVADDLYKSIRSQVVLDNTQVSLPDEDKNQDSEKDINTEDNSKKEEVPDLKKDPFVEAKPFKIPKIDFDLLKEINPQVVAWICFEDGVIDYPLVKGEDNYYYLDRLFTKETNSSGSIFLDFRNSEDFSDKTAVIYGHNMKNGTMFAQLMKYKSQDFYEKHPRIYLITPRGDFVIELFSGFLADGKYEFIRFDFLDDLDFLDYIDSLYSLSTFTSSVKIEPNDQVMALSTCAYDFSNARFVVFGKLIPIE